MRPTTCPRCHGARTRLIFGSSRIVPCEHCGGSGWIPPVANVAFLDDLARQGELEDLVRALRAPGALMLDERQVRTEAAYAIESLVADLSIAQGAARELMANEKEAKRTDGSV